MNGTTVNAVLREALSHHQDGRLDQAFAGYQSVLQAVPDHPDALALAGMCAFHMNRLEAARRLLEDAARAVRWVRSQAGTWKLDPQRVGIMGSSAGGHLASTLLTHFTMGQAEDPDPVERQSSRPDLGILCYPVITLGEFTHAGSKANLLGPTPSPELVALLSNELQVTTNTPPTFLWHTVEDSAVPVENSLLFAQALRRNRVPFDLHLYERGRHGIGLGNGHVWTKDLTFWLGERGFLKK
mgnify:CR=1 FL=1